jgi:hypothetical protein
MLANCVRHLQSSHRNVGPNAGGLELDEVDAGNVETDEVGVDETTAGRTDIYPHNTARVVFCLKSEAPLVPKPWNQNWEPHYGTPGNRAMSAAPLALFM